MAVNQGRFQEILARCRNGTLPPALAVMHLISVADSQAEVETALTTAIDRDGGNERLQEALAILRSTPEAFQVLHQLMQAVDHGQTNATGADAIAYWAAAFNRAVAISPEGSVAFYSLGRPDNLRSVTSEVVDRLREWGLLGTDRQVLDIGCGIGRVEEMLAPFVGHVIGIDISPGMVREAQNRCASLANVEIRQASGTHLGAWNFGHFDLVLAIDSFPYLVQAGMEIADAHIHDTARILRPGGSLVILNFSYRSDPDQDRADIIELAGSHGFEILRNGSREFSSWDGLAFHLRKPVCG